MQLRAITSRLRNESGQAAVEFALVFVFALLPILFVITDYGRAFNAYNDLNQMAADGARFAAVARFPGASALVTNNADTNATSTAVICGPIYLSDSESTPSKDEPGCPPPGTCAVGKRVWIRARATITFVPLLKNPSKQLEGRSEMRVEGCPPS
jgi:Flp pilus assembly protein TadG